MLSKSLARSGKSLARVLQKIMHDSCTGKNLARSGKILARLARFLQGSCMLMRILHDSHEDLA